MDIKAPLDKYYKISDVYPSNVSELINQSINLIMDSGVFLECRTTYVPNLLVPEDIFEITRNLNCDMYTLQQFRNRVTLDSGLSSVDEPNPEDLVKIIESLDVSIPEIHLKSNQFGNQTIIRNMD